MPLISVDQVMMGLLMAGLGIGAIYLGSIIYRVVQGRSLQDSVVVSTENFAAVFGAGVGLIATGILNLGMFVDLVTQSIATHPYAVTNIVTIGLGAIGLETGTIGAGAYLVATVAFVGFALLMTEVRG